MAESKSQKRTRPTSLTLRILLGKLFGAAVGVSVFFSLPVLQPSGDWALRFGMLGWYLVFGVVIAFAGLYVKHPVLGLRMPPLLRGGLVGFGLNLVLGCLVHQDMMQAFASYSDFHFANSMPIIELAIEGLIWGALIDAALTFYAGQGKDLVKKL
jgi:hypothetical protein